MRDRFELGYRLGYAAGVDVGRGQVEAEYAADWHDLFLHVRAELAQPTPAQLHLRRSRWAEPQHQRPMSSAELDVMLALPDPVACGGRPDCTVMVTPPTIVCGGCVAALIHPRGCTCPQHEAHVLASSARGAAA